MRRPIPALLLLMGCASPGQPPGGPPDTEPPRLISVTPDTGSRNIRADRITWRFDEVVNERSSPRATGPASASGRGEVGGMLGGGGFGGGASGSSTLASMFVLSPSDGRERITWKREAIEVVPRGGFRAQTTYRAILLPGLGDLRGNVAPEGLELVFSTGPRIATGEISGALFDWPAGRVAANAPLEAFSRSDTLFRWRTRSDATGRFTLPYLVPGTYVVRGWVDQNTNGALDPREAMDSVSIRLDSTAAIDLYAFVRDTIGPRIDQVEIVDSIAIRIKFDKPTAVDWRPTDGTLRVLRSDSSIVSLGPLLAGGLLDSAIATAQATRAAQRDSVARDAAARDPSGRDSAARAPAPPSERLRDRPGAARDSSGADTTPARPRPVLQRPIPAQTWGALLRDPLPPGLYRVRLTKVRGMSGAVRDSEREIRLRPPPPPKRDSTAAPRPSGPPPARVP